MPVSDVRSIIVKPIRIASRANSFDETGVPAGLLFFFAPSRIVASAPMWSSCLKNWSCGSPIDVPRSPGPMYATSIPSTAMISAALFTPSMSSICGQMIRLSLIDPL